MSTLPLDPSISIASNTSWCNTTLMKPVLWEFGIGRTGRTRAIVQQPQWWKGRGWKSWPQAWWGSCQQHSGRTEVRQLSEFGWGDCFPSGPTCTTQIRIFRHYYSTPSSCHWYHSKYYDPSGYRFPEVGQQQLNVTICICFHFRYASEFLGVQYKETALRQQTEKGVDQHQPHRPHQVAQKKWTNLRG